MKSQARAMSVAKNFERSFSLVLRWGILAILAVASGALPSAVVLD